MPDADVVLAGGRVLTQDDRGSSASAIAIRGGRIVAVGEDGEIAAWIGRDTRSIALDGRVVLPGFIDPHTHVAGNARDTRNVECRDFFDPSISSLADILDRVREAADRLPAEDWVVAVTSPQAATRLGAARPLTKADLDSAVPDRPSFITFGPHQTLANSRALDACGIGRETPDPNGGEIVRGPDGAPTGLLRETAQQIVKRARPGSEDDLETRLHGELVRCASRGVTQIHDVVTTPAEVRAYAGLAAKGRLPIRVRLLVRAYQSQFETWSIQRLGVGPDFGSDDLRIGAIKLSVDGGSSAGQAAFYPAPDRFGEDPVLRMTQEELDPIVAGYHAAGIQVCIHAVGDMAVDMALRSLEAAIVAQPRADHRHRVEHMGNFAVTKARLETARSLGLVPVPNPSGLYYLGPSSLRTYSPERLGRVYAFRMLVDEGLPFTAASDGGGLWPVDPLRDIAASVTRRARDGSIIGAEDAVTVAEALRAYTTVAAWAGFDEDRLGSLTPGRLADLAILRADLAMVEPDAIGGIEVDLTMKGGRVTHEREPVSSVATPVAV
jgi:predicted amidohydrolase YtcJ